MRPRANRLPLELPVSFRELPRPGQWQRGRTVNISQSGVFFKPIVDSDLPIGTRLEFNLVLSANGAGQDLAPTGVAHCTGRVVRRESTRSALIDRGIIATIEQYQLTRVPTQPSKPRHTDPVVDRSTPPGTPPAQTDLQIRDLEIAIRLDVPVLISGGERCARETAAHLIHSRGKRRLGPFVHFICDRESGDAAGGWSRLIARAAGGTLYLEDVGDMTSGMQHELLEFVNMNASDVRIIAGSVHSLHSRVAGGCFAQALYYRLNVIHLECVGA